tara:strand:- start:17432 stop:20380 length:2949 start_codon:yes stop_codon:yes gene_type:complete
MKTKNLHYRDVDKLLRFLKPFSKKKPKLNPNYLKKKFFLDFFNIKKSNQSKCLILTKKNNILGFRGNIDKKFQYSINKKIKVTNGIDSLLWWSKADKNNTIKLLSLSENFGDVSSSVCYGLTEFYFKLSNYKISNLIRYHIPLDIEKFNNIKFPGIKINKIKSFGDCILEPRDVEAKMLEKTWTTISKKINLFSQYRDKSFWNWRYANCKYYNYLYWECPDKSGAIIGRVEKVFDSKYIKKNYLILRIIEILPLSKDVWKNGINLKFKKFFNSVLNWAKKNDIFAADFYISGLMFDKTLTNLGFSRENKFRRLPIIFSKINKINRPINFAYKNHKINNKTQQKYLTYFVKSDGGGDFPPSDMTNKKLATLRKINNNLKKKKIPKKHIILGIHDGFDCSASIMINGKIVYASQEERFTGFKTDYGLPINAIKDGLEYTKINNNEINEVSLATKSLSPILTKLKRERNFNLEDFILEQEKYWKPKFYENKKVNYYNLFKNKHKTQDKIYDYKNLLENYQSKKDAKIFLNKRIDKISSYLKINKNKIKVQLHEDCHKYYSYFFTEERKNGIAITAEGIGDYSRGSVSTVKEGNFKLISYNTENHLGNIYKYVVLLLGMRPAHHEYKVMGLAPYASKYEINKCYKFFDEILKVKGLNIVFNKKPKDIFFHFKHKLKFSRFDGIAGALQKFLEDKLNDWFLACSKKLSYKIFYFSGGVSQNIKAGMSLAKSKKFSKIYIPPAGGDSSISLGACYKSASDYCDNNKLNKLKYIKPLDNLYLGSNILDNEIETFIKKNKIKKKYDIIKNVKPKKIAKVIFDGNLVARCSGRMEFGLRALGNRSILCDPRFYSNINKINFKIKKRDFWMPFTPTILKEDFNKYIIDPKRLNSKFMTMAFDTTNMGRQKLQAAIHPADYSARPQKLDKIDNPDYYNILNEFKKLSGVGALLNTSFNLHGLPIVRTVKDAFFVFEKSDLDVLIVNNFFFKKK